MKGHFLMNTLQNLHTHTTYCDGRDTPEEMILHALDKGFGSVGFSGHSYMYFAPTHSMSVEGTADYKREVLALKEKYKGIIDVFLGLELEYYSEVETEGYEYMIGSLHYLDIEGEKVGFDRSAEVVRKVIDTYFGGDGLAIAKQYYRNVIELPDKCSLDILGHFDLITKNLELATLFDADSREYRNAAFEAIEALSGRIPYFEVNTGAIARGYRSTPYPSAEITRELLRRGFGAVISSDCHDGRMLDCNFEQARELLASCGCRERYVLTDEGFVPVAL